MGLSYFYNALMSPIQRHPGRLRRLVSPYGLHEANGARIAGWPHLVSLDTTLAYNRFRPKSSSFQPLSGEWIYGGVFYAGFGHFLIETLPNLFAVARSAALSSQRKALFFLQPNWLAEPNLPHYPSYCRLFFEYAGVDPDNFSFVTQPTEVERLIVGDSPFLKKFRYASWLLDTFDKEFSISRNTARKIYLSRSRWNHHLRLPGEPRIETIFSDYGYEIIHPQDLSIPKQIATICGAGRLAGSQGSALHWSLLSPDCRSVLALGSPLPQQRGICRSRGQELVELRGRKPSIGTVRQRLVGDATIHQALARLSD